MYDQLAVTFKEDTAKPSVSAITYLLQPIDQARNRTLVLSLSCKYCNLTATRADSSVVLLWATIEGSDLQRPVGK